MAIRLPVAVRPDELCRSRTARQHTRKREQQRKGEKSEMWRHRTKLLAAGGNVDGMIRRELVRAVSSCLPEVAFGYRGSLTVARREM